MEPSNQPSVQGRVDRRPRRRQAGVVVSDSRAKTIKVRVEFQAEHPRYGKQMRRRSVLHAHDPKGEAHVGDRVVVTECRPISKTKSWRLEKVLQAAPRASTT